jgi:hypothetical protein
MSRWKADMMKFQIDDFCSRSLPGDHKVTYWNDYPIAQIIVVAAAIKYLLEGLL